MPDIVEPDDDHPDFDGLPYYDRATQDVVFGVESPNYIDGDDFVQRFIDGDKLRDYQQRLIDEHAVNKQQSFGDGDKLHVKFDIVQPIDRDDVYPELRVDQYTRERDYRERQLVRTPYKLRGYRTGRLDSDDGFIRFHPPHELHTERYYDPGNDDVWGGFLDVFRNQLAFGQRRRPDNAYFDDDHDDVPLASRDWSRKLVDSYRFHVASIADRRSSSDPGIPQ